MNNMGKLMVICNKSSNNAFTKDKIYTVLDENGQLIKLESDDGIVAWIDKNKFTIVTFGL